MRNVIVVDVETTGLDREHDSVLEVAAVPLDPKLPVLHFVPYHEYFNVKNGPALTINRYFERRLYAVQLSPDETVEAFAQLWTMLDGNVLAGSNPRFDGDMLVRRFIRHNVGNGEPWHHRLGDLSSYTAGALGIPMDNLPGLEAVCEMLGVTNHDPHSAMGDAVATAECLRELAKSKHKRGRLAGLL